MQSDLLLLTARELTDDQAGGHGDRWAVFDDDIPALIGRWLGIAVERASVATIGLDDPSALDTLADEGEPAAVALLFNEEPPGAGNAGLISLIHLDPGGPDGEPHNELWSAFPFLGDGVPVDAVVDALHPFSNRIEARLSLSLSTGGHLEAFDAGFVRSRAVYRRGERYRFLVSGLAYGMSPAAQDVHVIDDPHEIRRFHARSAWAQTHGQWSPEDEAASLAAWQPESPEDLEPIGIGLGEMAALLPSPDESAGDAEFHGQVTRVTPRAVRLLETDFWRIDTVVRRDDEELVLPIYVAERSFEGDWRPEVGQYVSSVLWLQAHATARYGAVS